MQQNAWHWACTEQVRGRVQVLRTFGPFSHCQGQCNGKLCSSFAAQLETSNLSVIRAGLIPEEAKVQGSDRLYCMHDTGLGCPSPPPPAPNTPIAFPLKVSPHRAPWLSTGTAPGASC